jgi:hypothetical protein
MTKKPDGNEPPSEALASSEEPVPWLSDRLTQAEIESLRQDQNEALDYAQKVFPGLKIHRAK